MSTALFANCDVLQHLGTFIPEKSPLFGVLASVSESCNEAFQEQATEIGDEKKFLELKNFVAEELVFSGFFYQSDDDDQEDDETFFATFMHEYYNDVILYMWRGAGHSVVLSPSGAHGVDNMHIHSKEDWVMHAPWVELVDLVDLHGM
jgi:hypothetical protein